MPDEPTTDLPGWFATDLEPVDHDPFASVPGSSFDSDDSGRTSPSIAGHVFAAPQEGEPVSARYIAAHPQRFGALSDYRPSWSEGIQQGVSETAQRYGIPVEGAERMGLTARFGAENAPLVGNVLSANQAYRDAQGGDYVASALHGVPAMFLGPAARIADKAALDAAERMAARGVSTDLDAWAKAGFPDLPKTIHDVPGLNETIRQRTGWFYAPDGTPRFEISDHPDVAKFTAAGLGSGKATAGEVLDHPQLYRAYPEMKNLPVRFAGPDELGDVNGIYYPASSPGGERILINHQSDDPRSALLHELQHAVQSKEGFALGSSPEYEWPDATKNNLAWQIYKQTIDRYVANSGSRPPDSLLQAWVEHAADKAYRLQYGEAEARATQYRQFMTDADRRRSDPEQWMKLSRGAKSPIDPRAFQFRYERTFEPSSDLEPVDHDPFASNVK